MTPVIEHELPESWMNIFLISLYICFQAIWRLELINKAIKNRPAAISFRQTGFYGNDPAYFSFRPSLKALPATAPSFRYL